MKHRRSPQQIVIVVQRQQYAYGFGMAISDPCACLFPLWLNPSQMKAPRISFSEHQISKHTNCTGQPWRGTTPLQSRQPIESYLRKVLPLESAPKITLRASPLLGLVVRDDALTLHLKRDHEVRCHRSHWKPFYYFSYQGSLCSVARIVPNPAVQH